MIALPTVVPSMFALCVHDRGVRGRAVHGRAAHGRAVPLMPPGRGAPEAVTQAGRAGARQRADA